MKYLIIGSGGTGGPIGAFLAKDGQDVTFIARGKNLEAMKENGFKIISDMKGEFVVEKPKVVTAQDYNETPDVIFVCVKGYSMDMAMELISRCASEKTVIIPVLNIFGTGGMLREKFPNLHILDGCIYITAYISAPGVISQPGKRFTVVFGEEDGKITPELEAIAQEMNHAGIDADLCENVAEKCFRKYSYISPTATAGAYYTATMNQLATVEEMKATYVALTTEICEIAKKMGLNFDVDETVLYNLKFSATAPAGSTTSMQKDIEKGTSSELDGLTFEPVKLGLRYGVETPTYKMIAEKFGYKG